MLHIGGCFHYAFIIDHSRRAYPDAQDGIAVGKGTGRELSGRESVAAHRAAGHRVIVEAEDGGVPDLAARVQRAPRLPGPLEVPGQPIGLPDLNRKL